MKKLIVIIALALGVAAGTANYVYADEPPLTVSDVKVTVDPVPGTHEVTVVAANGEAYSVMSAKSATVDGKPILLAQADTAPAETTAPVASPGGNAGSATVAAPDAGSASEVPPITDPLTELATLKAKYDALLAARKDGSKDLRWFAYAAFAAAVIRTLLAGIKTWRGDKPTGWVKWAALGLAVPLALLTYYAAGAGLWAAIVMAGAGPGAVIVNELLKKKPAEAGA